MSLALGKNSSNVKQPLHLDNTNHLLVNDSTNKAVLDQIATNTANINVNVGDVEINVADLEALQAITNAKLIEISGKNTDIDVSVKANALTIAKLNQILTKNTEIDAVLDSCSAKLTDVDDSVKANALTIVKLNQILTKNTEIDAVLDSCSAKLSDIDTTAAATATILRPYLIEGNATNVLIKNSNSALVAANHTDLVALEASLTSMEGKQDSLVAANHTDLVALEASLTSMEGKQDTLITHVDGVEALLATIDADTGAIKTAVEILDNAISGSEMQVDVVSLPALAAGSATIGKLAANSGVDIGDVDVLSLPSLPTGSNTIGVVSLAAGSAAIGKLTANSGVDIGDVDVLSLPLTFNSGNKGATTQRVVIATDDINMSAIKTAVELIDDAIKTEDLAHSSGDKGIPCLMVRQDSHADLAADGDYMIPTINANGEIRVTSTAGGSTEAKQDDVIGHLDGVEGKLDALETTLTAIETDQAAIEVLLTAANVDHAANEVLLAAIDADTNAIKGLLTTLDGVQDNALASLLEIEGAVETIETCIKAEDVAHSSGDAGIMALCVRQDTQADFGANGDYCPMSINADGELRVTTAGGSTTMSVDTIHTASVDAGANGTSSVFTKPKDVSTLGFTIKNTSSANGVYQIVMETSVDNSSGSFVAGSNFNGAGDNRVNKSFASNELGFKFYRFRVTNGHVSAQAYKMQISY